MTRAAATGAGSLVGLGTPALTLTLEFYSIYTRLAAHTHTRTHAHHRLLT